MKRSLLAATILFLLVQPAFAFDAKRPGQAKRITLLQARFDRGGEYEAGLASRVRRQLVRELRERGFDAVDGRVSWDEVRRDERITADLFVELAPNDAYARAAGGASIGGRNGGVDVAVMVSRVAAELRVYDGRTLQPLTTAHLARESTSIVPTAVGVGTYRMGIWLALPFTDYMRYRNAVNAVAEDAAHEIEAIAR